MAAGELTLTIEDLSLVIDSSVGSFGYERFKVEQTTRQLSAFGTVAIFKPLFEFRYLWTLTDCLLTLAEANTLKLMSATADQLFSQNKDGAIKLADEVEQIVEPLQKRPAVTDSLTIITGGVVYLGEFNVLVREVRQSPIRRDPSGDNFGPNALVSVSCVLEELDVVELE